MLDHPTALSLLEGCAGGMVRTLDIVTDMQRLASA